MAEIRIGEPGAGLAPRYLDSIEGMRPSRDLPVSTPLRWEYFR
jgi:hypothetical protein